MLSGRRPVFHEDALHTPELQVVINTAWATAARDRPAISVLEKRVVELM